MKRINLFFAIFFCFSSMFGQQIPDSLLVVVIMIKNEAANIRATLKPFLDAGLQDFVVLDTGSTDDTIAITLQAFEDYGVKNGYIVQQPFVDFSTSRNYGLERAEELFPQAIFFIMPDAEWYMTNVEGLIEFCKKHKNAAPTSYLMYLSDGSASFCMQRLFKAHKGIRFVGVVHEMLNQFVDVKVPRDIYFEYRPTRQGLEASQRRWLRDKDLLLQEAEKDPSNLRTLFFLGQTFTGLGDLENACLWYKKIEQIPGGWEQERCVTFYRIAQTYEAMNNWNMALCYYLKAYNQRPSRIESLVRVAEHYWNFKEYYLSFMFAKLAVAAAPIDPNKDWFLVEQNLYDCGRYDVLGRAAWSIGEYEIGENAVRQALKSWPDATHLQFNLSLFENRK